MNSPKFCQTLQSRSDVFLHIISIPPELLIDNDFNIYSYSFRMGTLATVINICFNYKTSDEIITWPLYVTSSYSIWIFSRGVSGFATDCPCDVWCQVLTTCLLRVGPPFGNRFLNTSGAVGLTYWIVYFLYFDICNYRCLDTSCHFLALS